MKKVLFIKALAFLIAFTMIVSSLSGLTFVSAATENSVVWNDGTDMSKIECGSGVSASSLYGGYGLTISANTSNPTVAVCGDTVNLNQYDKVKFRFMDIGYNLSGAGITGVSASVDQTTWYTISGFPGPWASTDYEIPVSELGSDLANVSKIYVRLNGTVSGDVTRFCAENASIFLYMESREICKNHQIEVFCQFLKTLKVERQCCKG